MKTYAHYVYIFIIKHSIINSKIRHYTKEATPNNTNWPAGQILKRHEQIQQKQQKRFEKCAIFHTQQNKYNSTNKCQNDMKSIVYNISRHT